MTLASGAWQLREQRKEVERSFVPGLNGCSSYGREALACLESKGVRRIKESGEQRDQ